MFKSRVHISPIGFDVIRVTKPLTEMKADKAYLVSHSSDNNPTKKFVNKVKKELNKCSHVEIIEVKTDIWDMNDCLKQFKEIKDKEKNNDIFINISTGTKITAVAGMLTCMLWTANPYFVPIKYPDNIELPSSDEVGESYMLPLCKINKPNQRILQILSLLYSNNNSMRKSELIDELQSLEIIKQNDADNREYTTPAKHSQLRALLNPMITEWHYVRVEHHGRRSEVHITEEGKNALRIFDINKFQEHENRDTSA